MTAVRSNAFRSKSEQGFALILAILALMLLTFLGLALATSTSTELQIATNYRWGLQALYNAEAGAEAARRILRDPHWTDTLPRARTTPWIVTASPAPPVTSGAGTWKPPVYDTPVVNNDSWGNPLRHFEASPCDHFGHGMGYGAVLNDGTRVYQYVTSLYGKPLAGAATIWVRRPLNLNDGTASDRVEDNTMVVTVEGVAPFLGGNLSGVTDTASNSGAATTIALNRSLLATRVVEWTINDGTTTDNGDGTCNRREGQVGSGGEGSVFGGCEAVTATGVSRGLGTTLTDNGAQ